MGGGKSTYVPELTGVRAIAALLVLVLHANQNFPVGIPRLFERGYLGVDLFFFLSGFIIAHVYLGRLDVGRFLWHRFARLWPAHAAVLAGLIPLVLAANAAGIKFNEPDAWRPADLPAHFLMIHAWGIVDRAGWNAPSWSISAEWFAYFWFPGIAWALLRMTPVAALVAGTGALLVLAFSFTAAGWTVSVAWIGAPALVRVLAEFVCGACLYRAISGVRLSADWIGLLALCLFFGLASLGAHDLLLLATFPALLAGAHWAGPIVRAGLASRPVEWLGEISYSVYVIHFPLLLVLRRVADAAGIPALPAFLASLAATIAAAAVLFYAVERPARERLRRVERIGFRWWPR